MSDITLSNKRVLTKLDILEAAFTAYMHEQESIVDWDDPSMDDPRLTVASAITEVIVYNHHPRSNHEEVLNAVFGWVCERVNGEAEQQELQYEIENAERAAGWDPNP